MHFGLTDSQQEIVRAIEALCARFGDDYWLTLDREHRFPHEFHQALAKSGWLGIAMPAAHGGAGLGIVEAALMMHAIARSGAGFSGASAVHMNIFGLHPVVVFGNPAQQARWLPPLIAGHDKACFAVTEPNVGLNTLQPLCGARAKSVDFYCAGSQQNAAAGAHDRGRRFTHARPPPDPGLKSFLYRL
jgi:acyl-CoA dehydrogenase